MRKGHALEYLCRTPYGMLISVVTTEGAPFFDGIADRFDNFHVFIGAEGEIPRKLRVKAAWCDNERKVMVAETSEGVFYVELADGDEDAAAWWDDTEVSILDPEDFVIDETFEGPVFTERSAVVGSAEDDRKFAAMSVADQTDVLNRALMRSGVIAPMLIPLVVKRLHEAGICLVSTEAAASERLAA